LKSLENFFTEKFPKVNFNVFGSKATSLDIENSDIDISLHGHFQTFLGPKLYNMYNQKFVNENDLKVLILKKIANELLDSHVALEKEEVKVIEGHIPIIKGKCFNGVKFDIW